MARELRANPTWLLFLLGGVVGGCDPKTVDYEIAVKSDFPGMRIGVFTETGTTPLATTTKPVDKLVVQAPFKEKLVARFVDTDVRKVGLDPILNGPDKRTLAKAGKPVPMNLYASNVRDPLIESVEIVMGGPTDEALTVNDVPVDSKAVTPGTRLRVPVRATIDSGPVKVKIGAEPPLSIALQGRKEKEMRPAGFVWIDPTGTTCLQTRYVAYGAMHIVPGGNRPDPGTKRPSAKIHAFAMDDVPDIIVDEKVPDSVMGNFIGSRRVLERCKK